MRADASEGCLKVGMENGPTDYKCSLRAGFGSLSPTSPPGKEEGPKGNRLTPHVSLYWVTDRVFSCLI